MNIQELLTLAIERKASDLHISDNLGPRIRIDGELIPLNLPTGSKRNVLELLSPVVSKNHLENFEANWETDFSMMLPDVGHFRVNIFRQNFGTSAALRVIPPRTFTLDELGLPPIIKKIAEMPNGLVLVTGPTGCGKSTTLAAIIQHINKRLTKHIITIEDPIEYVHESLSCIIDQREVGRDTKSFSAALRSALREDPDIILVGELRDLETVQLALTAAETGHLVFATLHTSSAPKTIDRIIDIFPAGGERSLIQNILSESLQSVISQKLLKKVGGGRVSAIELMMCTPAIRSLIRDDKISQISSAIQTGADVGMQTMDQHLKKLVMDKVISPETAAQVANNKDFFK
ncbi:MAG TPA: type IV pilus twitching motility protein PilT [Gammaproteobacteria bacterium]|nr:type IV pilus twitching motility protein PilT [Gammaproteobacteria bacterium]